jgi:chromosomal replication initiation ATPase DnaA
MGSSQFTIDLAFSPSIERADFVLGGCNALAADWVDRWPDWPGRIKGLVLHGPADCGKSHLAAIWAKTSGATLLTELDAQSIHGLDDNPHVIWDHPAPSSSWPDDQVFHVLNRLAELNGSLLILSRVPMAELDWTLADVASRLNGLVSASIDSPDDDVLAAVIHKLADDCGLALDHDVSQYIVNRIDRSFAMARRLVTELNKVTLSEQHKLTIHLARMVLAREEFSGQASLIFKGESDGLGN